MQKIFADKQFDGVCVTFVLPYCTYYKWINLLARKFTETGTSKWTLENLHRKKIMNSQTKIVTPETWLHTLMSRKVWPLTSVSARSGPLKTTAFSMSCSQQFTEQESFNEIIWFNSNSKFQITSRLGKCEKRKVGHSYQINHLLSALIIAQTWETQSRL